MNSLLDFAAKQEKDIEENAIRYFYFKIIPPSHHVFYRDATDNDEQLLDNLMKRIEESNNKDMQSIQRADYKKDVLRIDRPIFKYRNPVAVGSLVQIEIGDSFCWVEVSQLVNGSRETFPIKEVINTKEKDGNNE